MRKLLLLAATITSLSSVFAQQSTVATDTSYWERKKIDNKNVLWPQVSIREAFEDISEKAKPAKAAVTWPQDKSNEYMVNAGLSISLNHIARKTLASGDERNRILSPSAFVVYNRNTLIKKLQNQLKIGLGLEYVFGKSGYSPDWNSFGYWNNTLQYANNIKDTSKSVIITTMVSPFRNNTTGDGVFWNSKKQIFDRFFYILSPSAGLELQNIYTATKKEKEGAIFRPNANASVSLLIMKRQRNAAGALTPAYGWPTLFEVKTTYVARYELINTTGINEGYVPLFKTDFSYYPLATDNVSLTLSYSDGADPVAGLEKQTFWQLGIQIKK